MGFIRRQEEKMAARLIQWHQQQQADTPLSPEALSQKASVLVTEAHRAGLISAEPSVDDSEDTLLLLLKVATGADLGGEGQPSSL